jgi:hypothetical protein
VSQDINLYAVVLWISRGRSAHRKHSINPMVDEDSNMIFSSCSSGSHLARPYRTPPCTLILEISPAWDILHVWIPGHNLPMQFLLAVSHNSSPPTLVVFQIEAHCLQGGAPVLSSSGQHL